MTIATWTVRSEPQPLADNLLKAAARFWFAVTMAGQLVLAFATASFYGLAALRGDFQKWNIRVSPGRLGHGMDDVVLGLHVFAAAIVMAGGALQLIPRVRDRFPKFHRWNGRVYMLTAVAGALGGLYLTWIRGTPGDLAQHVGSSLDAVLIFWCAAVALRHAVLRNFETHRRWALRLFMVVSANLFIRLAFFSSQALFGASFGFDPTTLRGPLLTSLVFGQYLVPLAVLELYFRAKDGAGALARIATASLLFVLTLAMAAAMAILGFAVWAPQIKAAFDARRSIAQTLSATIASRGIDDAARQYHDLKAAYPAAYDFDEPELNSLGYRLLRNKQLKEAIVVFELNVEAHPQSSNVYDSLGEAYLNDGDEPHAIANYERSLELNPKNRGALTVLQKLHAR